MAVGAAQLLFYNTRQYSSHTVLCDSITAVYLEHFHTPG